jgi:Flp pilus assembly protein TadD
MPREKSVDVAHEQVTDHRIQRRPGLSLPSQSGELTVVGGGPVSDRDLGLAYFQRAIHGDRQSGQRAMTLLQQYERRGGDEGDPDLHRALGFLEQMSGDRAAATREYQAALRADPQDSVAAGDLAILETQSGRARDAVTRLQQVSQIDPGETTAAMDLAMIECATGNPQLAVKALQRLLEFSPDDGKARHLLETCGHQ